MPITFRQGTPHSFLSKIVHWFRIRFYPKYKNHHKHLIKYGNRN